MKVEIQFRYGIPFPGFQEIRIQSEKIITYLECQIYGDQGVKIAPDPEYRIRSATHPEYRIRSATHYSQEVQVKKGIIVRNTTKIYYPTQSVLCI
jgi:hypothetical protein